MKSLKSGSKVIAFWKKNACILPDTCSEFCHASVMSIKRIVHRYILIGKIYIRLVTNQSAHLMSEYKLALIV